MNETLKISTHRFARTSMFFATIFFLCVLVCINSQVLGEARSASLEDPTVVTVLGCALFSAILWLVLKVFKTQWVFERPLRIGRKSFFQSDVQFLELPDACTLFRRGRFLYFLDASRTHEAVMPTPVATLAFATQRKAILNENLLLVFLDPERSSPLQSVTPLLSQARFAPVTFSLIAINVLISVYAWMQGDAFVMSGSLSRAAIAHGEYFRLLSNTFLHYNGIHLIMNMLALWSLGVQVERIVGRFKMLLIYLISGVCGGLWALQFIGSISLLGASGAVFGLFGAIAYFIFFGRDQLPATVYLPTRRQLTTDLMINAGLSLLPFVSFSAHFGGFVSGFVISGLLARIRTRA